MNKSKKLGEDGFAPIIVAIIIVIVLSLLTLGFVTLANNSAKNALNTQLSNDAYYAADSGVNDAIQAISNGYQQSKTTCGPISGNRYLHNNKVNGPQDTYSCLLINPTPANLQYSTVSQSQPTVVLLSTIDNSGGVPHPINPTDIVFSWEPSVPIENSPFLFAPSSYFSKCTVVPNINGPCLYPSAKWQGNKPFTGILRVAITPLNDGGQLPTDTSTTYTAFLYPQNGNNNLSLTCALPTPSINCAPSYSNSTIGPNSGLSVSGNCSNSSTVLPFPPPATITLPYSCNVDIPVGSSSTNGYILSMTSLYTHSRVVIEAYNGSTPLLFNNGQTMIDSTGDDHGVQRRIQVRIPSINSNGFPAYDIASSNSLCKDLQAYPPNLAIQSYNDPNVPGLGGATSSCGL